MGADDARGSSGTVDWSQYAKDARDLLVVTSRVGPTAMRVWTDAWCDWAKSAARTQEELARRCTSIVRNPRRGETLLNQMREDVKQYLVHIGGIPQRAVLDFAQSMEEIAANAGDEVDLAFLDAAEAVMVAAADVLTHAATASTAPPASKGPGSPAADPDPLGKLRDLVLRMRDAQARLRKTPGTPPAN
jgi:hypothetical protein